MGKSSGGLRGGSNGGGPKNPIMDLKGATEAGYTDKMMRNIVGIEQKYRTNKDETLHMFTPSGELIHSFAGKGAEVRIPSGLIIEHTILTHNHPRSLGQKGVLRIGNSLSAPDLYTMVRRNVREMRAVTPTYTYSMKRPKGGWGVTEQRLKRAYKKAERETLDEARRYIARMGNSKTAIMRANATFYHKVNKKLAAKFGWDYTKKNR